MTPQQQPAGEARPVPILRQWQGGFFEDRPHFWKENTSGGPIATAAAWAALWRSLERGDEAPAVDFSQELVVALGGPGFTNHIHLEPLTLSAQSDLAVPWGITEMYAPGFVCRFLVVPRAGVKTVNGAALDDAWFSFPG